MAGIFAALLAVTGAWSSKRRPWKIGGDGRAVLKAFAFTSMPFVLAEVVTGIASHITGHLSVPPVLGLGTAVDLGILAAGLLVSLSRMLKRKRPEENMARGSEGR